RPGGALARQHFDATEITDIPAAVDASFEAMVDTIQPGQRVCLGVGSRGIDRIAEVTRAAVRAITVRGGQPFCVPAMGSHGGGTAEGQLQGLASLRIPPEA